MSIFRSWGARVNLLTPVGTTWGASPEPISPPVVIGVRLSPQKSNCPVTRETGGTAGIDPCVWFNRTEAVRGPVPSPADTRLSEVHLRGTAPL